ncbi:MAG: DUF84 family protein [Acidobacteria bacterium]|nr:DUF84 family protein [Acidobacteriota bacterium]
MVQNFQTLDLARQGAEAYHLAQREPRYAALAAGGDQEGSGYDYTAKFRAAAELYEQLKGRSLAAVIDELAGRADIRSQEGTWGILTRSLITRQHTFRDALVNALAPFLLVPQLFPKSTNHQINRSPN